MKTLEKGQEKISKICSILREESLEPAKKQAGDILSAAQKQAEEIINAAEKNAEVLIASAKANIEQERNVFNSSLQQAAKQSLESLKQEIENNFFNKKLDSLIEKEGAQPDLIAKLVTAIVQALEKDGLSADLTALISKTIAPQEVNALLMKNVISSLKEKSVTIGQFTAGAQVKMNNKNMTIDITNEALKDLLATYVVRKDFRKMIFNA